MKKHYVIFLLLSAALVYFIYKGGFANEILKSDENKHEDTVAIETFHKHQQNKYKHFSSAEEKKVIAKSQSVSNPSSKDIIRDKLCGEKIDQNSCNIDLNLDLTSILIDPKLNAARVEEIGLVLQSKNYKEVMNSISGTSSINIMKSEKLNQRARDLSSSMNLNIESIFSCNEKLCAAEFRIDNYENWNKFQSNFFNGDAEGNIFILPAPDELNTLRVMLVLGENLPVVRRED